jgi:PAS domain S-box-containing protein
MHSWPLAIKLFEKPRFIPLRYRLILLVSFILVFSLGALALVLGHFQTETIRKQMENQGLAVAQSLAAASKADLLTYNYIALEQSANQAAQSPDIVYVVIHDKEGRVAAYSGKPGLQRTFLPDAITAAALASTEPLIQKQTPTDTGYPVLDVGAPVFLSSTKDRWGTIRVGVSQAAMFEQLRQTRWTIAGVGIVALVFGIGLSMWAARRVTRPVGELVHATMEAADGKLDQEIEVRTGDEVEILAANFSHMMGEILAHREQLEQQLIEIQRLQRYTEQLLTTMGDGLLSIDMEGRVVTINPAARLMLGLPMDAPGQGLPVASLVPEALEFLTCLRELMLSPGPGQQREVPLDRNGSRCTILIGSSILADADGRPQECILTLHDVTELKELEGRVRQSERLAALGTLAAGMAHEIRNPLASIKTFVQLVPRKVDKPDFMEKFQRTVPREINRLNNLIEDLLELARIPKYHFEATDLVPLLEQTTELFEEDLRQRGIQCRLNISGGALLAKVDGEHLIKVFRNLVNNALQAMATGGELTIEGRYDETGEEKEKGVVLVFQDTGCGISEDVLGNIFNPFFTTKDKGTGLGLAITHKVITEHGGAIDVASTVGEGTRFTVRLGRAVS